MPSTESTSPLVLEFNRKLKAALQLTRSYFERESKRIHDIVFPGPSLKSGQSVLQIRDVDDPKQSKSITGRDLRQLSEGAKDYYIDALFARMRLKIREYFRPVAQVAATLIAGGSGYFHEEAVFAAAFYITDDPADWVGGIYEYLGLNLATGVVKLEPAAAKARNKSDFESGFHNIFIDEWRQLLWEAQLALETPSRPSAQPRAVHEDARSRALAIESKSAADQEESREDRQRREVIRAAVKAGATGLAYCKFLDREQIHPSPRLRGCPDTYEAAYKVRKNGGFAWRQAIWDEKHYFSSGLSAWPTDPESTVN